MNYVLLEDQELTSSLAAFQRRFCTGGVVTHWVLNVSVVSCACSLT